MQPLRILVVDDEETILDVFRAVLEEDGHEVTTVGTGEAALDTLGASPFELVFLDIKLPGISGIDVLREVRKGADGPRVVMITGVLDDDLYDLSIYSDHAANGFITKPCSFQSIKDCVGKVMGEDRAFIRTPRDEFRYAATKVRRALETRGLTLAVAELTPGAPLGTRLVGALGFESPLRGTLGLLDPAAMRRLIVDEPGYDPAGVLITEAHVGILAERTRTLLGADWALAHSMVVGPLASDSRQPGGTAVLALTGGEERTTLTRHFSGPDEEFVQDACHAALVHLHGALTA